MTTEAELSGGVVGRGGVGPQITHLPTVRGGVALEGWNYDSEKRCWARVDKPQRTEDTPARGGKREKREIRTVYCGLFGPRLTLGT